jgi:hypothetical protein
MLVTSLYEVYHYSGDDPRHWFTVQADQITVRSADYVKVAEVEAENLDQVFLLTNTIDHDWQENDHVTPARPGQSERSTSTGDVIVMGDQAWIVESAGFSAVTFA